MSCCIVPKVTTRNMLYPQPTDYYYRLLATDYYYWPQPVSEAPNMAV
jgi:hypothetical protein